MTSSWGRGGSRGQNTVTNIIFQAGIEAFNAASRNYLRQLTDDMLATPVYKSPFCHQPHSFDSKAKSFIILFSIIMLDLISLEPPQRVNNILP